MPDLRPTCLIGDQLESNIPDRRPVGDQHASSETHQRPKCLIKEQHASSETHWRLTCLIGDSWETNMPDQRPIGGIHASLETDMSDWRPTLGKINISYGSPMRHVGF